MSLPWWGWLVITLWCFPGVYAAFALVLQKPIGGLDENGELPKPVPLFRKLIILPFALVVLVALWPLALWGEFDESRLLVKIMIFPFLVVAIVAAWPLLLLWREARERWR